MGFSINFGWYSMFVKNRGWWWWVLLKQKDLLSVAKVICQVNGPLIHQTECESCLRPIITFYQYNLGLPIRCTCIYPFCVGLCILYWLFYVNEQIELFMTMRWNWYALNRHFRVSDTIDEICHNLMKISENPENVPPWFVDSFAS